MTFGELIFWILLAIVIYFLVKLGVVILFIVIILLICYYIYENYMKNDRRILDDNRLDHQYERFDQSFDDVDQNTQIMVPVGQLLKRVDSDCINEQLNNNNNLADSIKYCMMNEDCDCD